MSELKERFINRIKRMKDLEVRFDAVLDSPSKDKHHRSFLLVMLLDTMRKVGQELTDLHLKLEVAGELDSEVRQLWKEARDKEFEQYNRCGGW